MSQKDLLKAPEKLIDDKGRVQFGNFAGPLKDVNWRDFDYTHLRRWPWTASKGLSEKLFKRWQFVGAIDNDFVVGAAVAHLHYLGTGFAYAYDRKTGKIIEKNIKSPLAGGTIFSQSPMVGDTKIGKKTKAIVMNNDPGAGHRTLKVDFGPDLRMEFDYQEIGTGVTTVSRQAMYGFSHTYKSAGLPAKGKITVNGSEHELGSEALALLDWSSATPPRVTAWNWAAGVGRDNKGRTLGINFGTGLITAGITQNAVWVQGKPKMIGGVEFDYNQKDILGTPWRLYSTDEAVDLEFKPDQERFEDVNFGFAASCLHQPFGTFSGTIRLDNTKLDVELFGFCEEHYAKW